MLSAKIYENWLSACLCVCVCNNLHNSRLKKTLESKSAFALPFQKFILLGLLIY